MTVKLNLTYVDRKERVSARTNKPFTSISIKATQYGDKFLSGFGNKDNQNWAVGDEVEVAEIKEVVKDGKTYLNFEMSRVPRLDPAVVNERLEKLENAVVKLHLRLVALEPKEEPKIIGTDMKYPEPGDEGLEHLTDEDLAVF